jgi:PadR family transcriptional regulator, regulatory protein PadR
VAQTLAEVPPPLGHSVGVSSGGGATPYVRILTVTSRVRITIAVARVLREFLADVHRPRYGYDLMQVTGYPSGKLYPILARLAEAGWLIREREDIDHVGAGRPARYLYRLSERGALAARRELTAISEQLAVPPLGQPAPPARPRSDGAPDGICT